MPSQKNNAITICYCSKCCVCGEPREKHGKDVVQPCAGFCPLRSQIEKKENWKKELKDLEVIMTDGFYKGCKFYHEAVELFIEKLLAQIRLEVAREAASVFAARLASEYEKHVYWMNKEDFVACVTTKVLAELVSKYEAEAKLCDQ